MPNEPIMDNRQRALQLWSLLVLAARTQTILSYGMVAHMTGLANEHPDPLGYIAFYCMQHKLPLLSLLEVSPDTGNPAADFYGNIDIAAEQRRCFVYPWLEEPVPTLEQLREAWNNREKLKETYKARKATAGQL
jgi:hypothetical protein